jgi:hypothetical protein
MLVRIGVLRALPTSVDPIQGSIQNFEIQNRLTKHGPVVAISRVGCANCLRPEKPSTIYGLIDRSLAVVPTADESTRYRPSGSNSCYLFSY